MEYYFFILIVVLILFHAFNFIASLIKHIDDKDDLQAYAPTYEVPLNISCLSCDVPLTNLNSCNKQKHCKVCYSAYLKYYGTNNEKKGRK